MGSFFFADPWLVIMAEPPDIRDRSLLASLRDLALRPAIPSDAPHIWRLARDSNVLDLNSPYSYVLVCTHFADTSLVAEVAGRRVGFLSSYRLPSRPDVIFVWQVAVDEPFRGRGVAMGLLLRLYQLAGDLQVDWLEATVSASNHASRALFRSFAARLGVDCSTRSGFSSELFGGASHEAEPLVRIGPLPSKPVPRHLIPAVSNVRSQPGGDQPCR